MFGETDMWKCSEERFRFHTPVFTFFTFASENERNYLLFVCIVAIDSTILKFVTLIGISFFNFFHYYLWIFAKFVQFHFCTIQNSYRLIPSILDADVFLCEFRTRERIVCQYWFAIIEWSVPHDCIRHWFSYGDTVLRVYKTAEGYVLKHFEPDRRRAFGFKMVFANTWTS